MHSGKQYKMLLWPSDSLSSESSYRHQPCMIVLAYSLLSCWFLSPPIPIFPLSVTAYTSHLSNFPLYVLLHLYYVLVHLSHAVVASDMTI